VLAHKQQLAEARAKRREQDRRDGKLLSKSERARETKNKAFVASLQGGVRVTASSVAATPATEKEEQDDNTFLLRAPVCCLIAHVDSGKTSLLDRTRGSRVAAQEAGGITQQLSAVRVSFDTIQLLTGGQVRAFPAAWVLDTPPRARVLSQLP